MVPLIHSGTVTVLGIWVLLEVLGKSTSFDMRWQVSPQLVRRKLFLCGHTGLHCYGSPAGPVDVDILALQTRKEL